MNNLIVREWNGKTIRQREDGYINATDMCQACDKKFSHWWENKSTQQYLQALSESVGITASTTTSESQGLVEVIKGGNAQEQGTWIHRKVALRLAQWLSPEFAVQVDAWIEELLESGKVELSTDQPTSALEVLEQMVITYKEQQEQIQKQNKKLEQHDIDIFNAKEQLMAHDAEIDNLKTRIYLAF